MLLGQWFTCVGLGLDIIGVALLFKYDLPSRYPHKGMIILWPSGEDEVHKEQKRRHFIRFAHVALVLLISGFVLQIVGAICDQ